MDGWVVSVAGFVGGLVISTVTTPVGVSGAVFLLPVQLDALKIPSPQVTPTNLLFNLIAVPGALLRYRKTAGTFGPLTRTLVTGTLPGVIAGAVVRVELVPDVRPFKLIAAGVLAGIGVFVLRRRTTTSAPLPPSRLRMLSLAVGFVGGLYGIGGGSILGPVLVGTGMSVAVVAPAALASTFVTSAAGAATYVVLAIGRDGDIAPDWRVGIACGLGGLVGGQIGARLQPKVPEHALRTLLGVLALAVAAIYLTQAL